MTDGVLIVGAGAAGIATAAGLRRQGYEGTITVVGDESVPPYDRPPLSKQVLSGAWDPEQSTLLPPARIDALGARWRLGGRAVALNVEARTVALDDGSELGGEHIVLATGVRPRALPGQPPRARVLRTMADAVLLRGEIGPGTRLVVVGGGFLGLEVAATASGLGAAVTVVEPVAEPMAQRVGSRVATRLLDLHAAHGVDVRAGTTVGGIVASGENTPMRVETDSGGELLADVVLVAIGADPNVEWLAGSGLELDDGVVCDEWGRAAEGVWAAGDVARWRHAGLGRAVRFEHRMNANEHGTALAKAIAGTAPAPLCSVPFFWTDQYDAKVQLVGTVPTGCTARVVWEEGEAAVEVFELDGQLTGAVGWNAMRQMAAHRSELARLLAASACERHLDKA